MDIIRLLPENLANQIAAGEVVQRPASVVKELLENSIDASSSNITLIVKDGGKQLIQVIDNGKGMSMTDSRMSFERHATSKIAKSEDLFDIHTFGFRGEALASIAAVAMVELKSKREEDEIGTRILVDNSEFKIQEPVSMNKGTSISVRNLFFNVPARKNFLKNNSIEIKHITEEFLRVALAHPEINFSFINEEDELFHLNSGNLKQRIVALFGKKYNEGLLPIEETTGILDVQGFIVKPEYAKKNRNDQYFFANGRFIKSPYLNHSIGVAFFGLLPPDYFPGYFIFLQVPNKSIDINVHPTKTEVKFQDEKAIYAYLNTLTKKSLNQFHAAPTLSFDEEPLLGMGLNSSFLGTTPNDGKFHINVGGSTSNPSNLYGNPDNQPMRFTSKATQGDWKELYKVLASQENVKDESSNENEEIGLETKSAYWQLHKQYILTGIKSGLMMIHQQMAHERILFEQYLSRIQENETIAIQRTMFPEMMEIPPVPYGIFREMIPEIRLIGLEIEEFGKHTIVITGSVNEIPISTGKEIIEGILEQIQNSNYLQEESYSIFISKMMAYKNAIRSGMVLTTDQMQALIDELFACKEPYFSPSGKPVVITISYDELSKKFKQN